MKIEHTKKQKQQQNPTRQIEPRALEMISFTLGVDQNIVLGGL